jgi:hypothetical protein
MHAKFVKEGTGAVMTAVMSDDIDITCPIP